MFPGGANLHGLLDINLIGGYFGELGKSFDVLTASSIDTSGMTLSESVFSKSIVAGGNGVVLRITQDAELVLDWNNPLGGDFQSTANWNPVISPNSIHTTRYNTPGQNYTVDFTGDINNLRAIHKNGDVTLDLAINTYTLTNSGAAISSLSVGDVSGDNASLTVTNGTFNTQHVRIGENGSTGVLTVGTGGMMTAVETRIGSGGTLNLDSGSLTTGSLDNTNGGALNYNQGTLTIDGGLFDQGAVDLVLDGAAAANNPTLTLINGASVDNLLAQEVAIGNNNQATLNILSGSSVSNNGGFVGKEVGSTGTVTVDGTGSTWTNSHRLRIGNGGAGTLNITNGGSVSNADRGFIAA